MLELTVSYQYDNQDGKVWTLKQEKLHLLVDVAYLNPGIGDCSDLDTYSPSSH